MTPWVQQNFFVLFILAVAVWGVCIGRYGVKGGILFPIAVVAALYFTGNFEVELDSGNLPKAETPSVKL